MNQKQIRVLCVMSTLDRGGAESMCMNLYRHIDRNKVQFDFIKHTHGKGSFEDEILGLGGKIFEAPRFRVYNYLSYRHWWIKHLKEHPEHQIIHGYFFTISAVFFSIAQEKGRKTVGHIHASASDSRIKEMFEKKISRFTDYPLACSQQAGKWIYGDRPFTVLNNALDTSLFRYSLAKRKQIRNKLGLDECMVLGTVANLSHVKNPIGLLDIFQVIHIHNPATKLIWVGEGNERNVIESRIHAKKIEDCVLLLGTRNDVHDLLQAMDIFLLPSFNEGLPVSVIEAQAAGLPCYISDSVTSEVDITGLCHFLPINEPEKWANAVLSDHTVRIDTSMKIVEAGYDIGETSKWLEQFYLGISASKYTK